MEPPPGRSIIICRNVTRGSIGLTEAFDIVIVPDFREEQAPRFETRTLLFLASWLENATLKIYVDRPEPTGDD